MGNIVSEGTPVGAEVRVPSSPLLLRKNKRATMLVPGHVYRRAELAPYSTNIDRHLAQLVAQVQ